MKPTDGIPAAPLLEQDLLLIQRFNASVAKEIRDKSAIRRHYEQVEREARAEALVPREELVEFICRMVEEREFRGLTLAREAAKLYERLQDSLEI